MDSSVISVDLPYLNWDRGRAWLLNVCQPRRRSKALNNIIEPAQKNRAQSPARTCGLMWLPVIIKPSLSTRHFRMCRALRWNTSLFLTKRSLVPCTNKFVKWIFLLFGSQVNFTYALYNISHQLAIALAHCRLCGTLPASQIIFPLLCPSSWVVSLSCFILALSSCSLPCRQKNSVLT